MKQHSAWRRGVHGTSRFAWRWIRRAIYALIALLLAVAAGFAGYAVLLLPDLAPWHTDRLEHEFDARRDAQLDFAGYQALEQQLFAGLQAWQAAHADTPGIANTRFDPNGAPARLSGGAPFNRSYRLEVTSGPVRASALLVHGLTDSPYSMRALAETLNARGVEVTVLRLPGHGTLPSMLTHVSLADWQAAVRMAARDAAARRPAGAPFYLAGYSTGGTLVLSHALAALDDSTLPRATRLFLIAPAIRIAPGAGLANLLDAAAVLPVAKLQKVKWQDLGPEYDPYKFNSFPVNATRLVHAATRGLQEQLQTATQSGKLAQLPPIMAWQSLVDSTIGTRPLVELLFSRLDGKQHELVLFDINSDRRLQSVASAAPPALRAELVARPRTWQLTLVGNADVTGLEVTVRNFGASSATSGAASNTTSNATSSASNPPGATASQGATIVGATDPALTATTLRWPADVISLSHVALPFRPDDPVYGLLPGSGANGLPSLGSVSLRGEAGALLFPLGALTRLRSNPFWNVIETQVQARVDQDLQAAPAAR
jgi:alpha-beta hydrolase superfamily lysophospholipase